MAVAEEISRDLKSCIGKQILKARNTQGKTQKDITASAGFSVSLLNKYETGETLPIIPNLIKLSELLGVSVDALLQEYHPDFLVYAIDSYLARIDGQTGKNILDEVRGLLDGE